MPILRIIHLRNYNSHKRRFQKTVFTNSSGDGGISVVDILCIGEVRSCEHIHKYYTDTAGSPIIYWQIEFNDLIQHCTPTLISIQQATSHTGDECHYNIQGVSDKNAEKFFRVHCAPPNIFYCCNGDGIPLTNEQYENIYEFECPN